MAVLINRIKRIELDLNWLKKAEVLKRMKRLEKELGLLKRLEAQSKKLKTLDIVIFSLVALILIVAASPQL